MALRRSPGSTCKDHGECWRLKVLGGLQPELVGTSGDRAAVLKLDTSALGKGIYLNTLFSPLAETELLSQQKVPAHFVALNGNRLNISLKTGPEVRAQQGMLGYSGGSSQNGQPSLESPQFSDLTGLMSPGMSPFFSSMSHTAVDELYQGGLPKQTHLPQLDKH